ncbi:MAG: tetratricopeptide repeat protein [Isosphaeraceae bacterium]
MARFERLEFDDEAEGLPAASSPEAEGDQGEWLRRADDHRRRGLYENALRYYSRALELDRTLLPGWVGQVRMLVLLGEFPEAELWARKALELFKGQGDLMAARAQALARIGDRTVAQELADAAIRQEGNSAYRWMVRGELLISTRDEVDRHCFDKAIEADRDWLVPLEIALIYLHYDQPSKGLLRAIQAVEKAPEGFYAWFVRGRCEQAVGFDRAAKASYERCLELSPRHVEAGRKIAELENQGWSLSRGLRRLIGR